MVAYSFRQRFIEPILLGTKRQTIRANRKRHARPGEVMSLYTGLRTKQCKLITRVTCHSVLNVTLGLVRNEVAIGFGDTCKIINWPGRLDQFARGDGFTDWADMRHFWAAEHPGIEEFSGVLLTWEAIPPV